MQVHSHCYHRFSDIGDNAAFLTEDGIEVHVTGAAFQKCVTCGHIDFPVNTKEAIEASLKENRKTPLGTKQVYINLVELF